MKKFTLAAIGCGARTQTYFNLASQQPELFEVVAGADPNEGRLNEAAELSRNPQFRRFKNDAEILSEPQLADVMIIGTQDQAHEEQAVQAMERGYHLLLEKPMAVTREGLLRLKDVADKTNRRVVVCHVLRYTPFYRTVKDSVDSGMIGELINFHATEGVEPWHYAHSYVRGQWSRVEEASPMILAKCCHDMDILRWITDSACSRISSFGRRSHFRSEGAPTGAPKFCLDGCPVSDSCHYNAERYIGDHRHWLKYALEEEKSASEEAIRKFLHSTRWGHCVYQTDNDAVDHQTLNLDFANGVTGTFAMHGFGGGRNLELYGTKGRLYAGEQIKQQTGHAIIVIDLEGKQTPVDFQEIEGGYEGHFGGDQGLVNALYHELTVCEENMITSLKMSIDSHAMAFAAEDSRITSRTIELNPNQ